MQTEKKGSIISYYSINLEEGKQSVVSKNPS